MMTRVLTVLPLLFMMACNQEDYYEKEFLENPFQTETPGEIPGGDHGGSTTGDGGDTGGSSGGTGGEVTEPGGTGGSDGGGTSGGEEVVGTDYSEIFTQKEINTRAVDILWVVDDSGSMDPYQLDLSKNFKAFIKDFVDSGVDYKMSITTTDVTQGRFGDRRGAIVAGSEKLSSAYVNANPLFDIEKHFENTIMSVGTNGSGAEKGLEASYWFMQKHSQNFLRPDAYLAIVYVSDEEDQSGAIGGTTIDGSVKSYIDHLKTLKSDAGLVKVYSIVNTDIRPQQGLTVGFERYNQASIQTAGQLADVREDFYTTLTDMGGDLRSLLDSFALAHTPIDGTLRVLIDNEVVTNYTYDAGSRAIKFDANHLPPVGASIKVEYKY